jgi:hypothetical protein
MANYIVKYFNNIYDHAAQIAEVCRQRARLAYVIGNSKFYDHPLPSDGSYHTGGYGGYGGYHYGGYHYGGYGYGGGGATYGYRRTW